MIPYAFGLVIVACLPLPGLAHAASSDTALATSHRLMRERRYDEAVVYLQAALDSTKRPNPVAKFLAFCFARTGQYDDAIALLERLCEAGKMGRSLVTHLWIPTAEFPTPTTELAILSRRTTPASAFGLCLPPTRLFERLAQTNLAQLWLVEGQAALDAGNTASATQHLWRAPEECPHADRPVWLRAKQAHSKLHWAAHEQVSQVFRKHLRGRDFATAAQAFHDVAWAYPYTTPGARAFYFEAKCLRDLGEPTQAGTLFKSFLKKHSHSHLASTACYQLGQQAQGRAQVVRTRSSGSPERCELGPVCIPDRRPPLGAQALQALREALRVPAGPLPQEPPLPPHQAHARVRQETSCRPTQGGAGFLACQRGEAP